MQWSEKHHRVARAQEMRQMQRVKIAVLKIGNPVVREHEVCSRFDTRAIEENIDTWRTKETRNPQFQR